MNIKGYITHKLCESDSDCQDYFHINPETRKIAISDGMSQSIFQSKWAQILVQSFTASDSDDITNQLPQLQKQWQDYAQKELKRQEEAGVQTWMLENCLLERNGAGATFCGLHLLEATSNEISWELSVLGDTCLIHIAENDTILKIYPPQEQGFGNRPDYFDSFTEGKGELMQVTGVLKTGEKLLLASDPIAEFLYLQQQKGEERQYVHRLLGINNFDAFLALIDDWRSNENMHNDDSTVVIVEYDGNNDIKIDGATTTLEDLLKPQEPAEKPSCTTENVAETMGMPKSFYITEKDLPLKCRNCKKRRRLLKCLNKWLYSLWSNIKSKYLP